MPLSHATAIDIVPLQPREVSAFLKFPWQVYAGDPHWVPPLLLERKTFLNAQKNPFFQHATVQLFLARLQRQIVGRIAAVINDAHNQYHHEQAGFFGLFECLHDAEVATALLHAAASWVREHGATFLRGPVNLSTNELDCGILVDGFDSPPVFQSAYNPPYYASLIEAAGFAPCKDLLTFFRAYDPPPPPRMQQAMTRLQERRNITIRTINMQDLPAEVGRITAVYNDAWSDNWGFVPITQAESLHMASELKLAILPEMTLIAERDGEPIGCFVAIPDLNHIFRHMNGRVTPWGLLRFLYQRRRIPILRVAMLGVKKRYRRLGIDLLLLAEVWKQAAKCGIQGGELGWVLEDNRLMIQALEELGSHPYKRYRLYQQDFV